MTALIDYDFHQEIKKGIKMMIDLFCGGFGDQPNNNRLALLEFSFDAYGLHAFSRDQRPSTLKAVVDKLFPMFGYTCTEKSFALAEIIFREEQYGTFIRLKLELIVTAPVVVVVVVFSFSPSTYFML